MTTFLTSGHYAIASLASVTWLQQDSINSGNSKLLMIFVGLTMVAMVTQALVVVALGWAAYKAQKALLVQVAEIKAKAYPVIEKAHALVDEFTPQVRDITAKVNLVAGHVEKIAAMAQEKATEFSPTISAANVTFRSANEAAADATKKTRAQITRVDGMISTALNATARLGVAIEQGITKPGREIAGVIAGVKMGMETLLGGARAFGSGATVGKRPVAPPAPRPQRMDMNDTVL